MGEEEGERRDGDEVDEEGVSFECRGGDGGRGIIWKNINAKIITLFGFLIILLIKLLKRIIKKSLFAFYITTKNQVNNFIMVINWRNWRV